MTQSVCVPTAEAVEEPRLDSLMRAGPPTEKEIPPSGPSEWASESRSFPSPRPRRAPAELFIVIPDVGRTTNPTMPRAGGA